MRDREREHVRRGRAVTTLKKGVAVVLRIGRVNWMGDRKVVGVVEGSF